MPTLAFSRNRACNSPFWFPVVPLSRFFRKTRADTCVAIWIGRNFLVAASKNRNSRTTHAADPLRKCCSSWPMKIALWVVEESYHADGRPTTENALVASLLLTAMINMRNFTHIWNLLYAPQRQSGRPTIFCITENAPWIRQLEKVVGLMIPTLTANCILKKPPELALYSDAIIKLISCR